MGLVVDIESTTAYFIIENLQVNCGSYTTASIALTLNTVSNGEVLSSSLFPAASILSSNNDVFSGNVIQGGGCGAQACLQTGQVLYITHSSTITVSNNQINLGQFNSCVVGTDFSSNLQLVNNTIQGGDVPCGLGLYVTNNSVISQNRITDPSVGPYIFANIGLSIYNSLSDQVFGNNITQEQNGEDSSLQEKGMRCSHNHKILCAIFANKNLLNPRLVGIASDIERSSDLASSYFELDRYHFRDLNDRWSRVCRPIHASPTRP